MFRNRLPRTYGRDELHASGPGRRRDLKRCRVKYLRTVVNSAYIEESAAELGDDRPDWYTLGRPPAVDPSPIVPVHRGLHSFVRARRVMALALVLLAMTCGCASNRRGMEVQVHTPDVNTAHPVVGATARVFVDFY